MATITSPLPGSDLQREPYYDDYKPDNEYYQILFKAGLAPQARELTQLQTNAQEQSGRGWNTIYKNGSPIDGAQTSISRANTVGSVQEATLTSGYVYFNSRFISVDNLLDTEGKYTVSLDTGLNNFEDDITANLDAVLAIGDTEMTLTSVDNFPDTGVVKLDDEFIQYTSVNTTTLQLEGLTRGYLTSIAIAHITSTPATLIPSRSGFKTDDTAYTFTYDGSSSADYVENPSSNDEYDTWFNGRNFQLGYKIDRSIVTSSEDESLLDNSIGSPNFNAPGADRLKLHITLDIRPLNQEYPEFIFTIKYKNGSIVEQKVEPQYSEILEYWARQVSEIQGDFSINPHIVSVLNWSAKELQADPTREDTFALNIGSGKTYVQGFRRETLVPTRIELDKGYDNISSASTNQNNDLTFISADSFDVDLSTPGLIPLHKICGITINVGGVQNFYAWVRSVKRTGTNQYTVDFTDASSGFYSNFSSGVQLSFYDSEDPTILGSPVSAGTSTSEVITAVGKQLVYNTKPNALNFKDLAGYTKRYQTTAIPGGTTSFTLDNYLAGEVAPSNASEYGPTALNPNTDLYVIDSTGVQVDTGFNISTTGVNQIVWTATAPINDYTVYFTALGKGTDKFSSEVTQLWNTNDTAVQSAPTALKPTLNVDQFVGGGSLPGFYDVFKINSIIDSNGVVYKKGVDYTLLTNQTARYFYGSIIRWLKNRNRPTVSFTVDFNYWDHQGTSPTAAGGSYIVSDSFFTAGGGGKDYVNISKYLGRRRSDIFDFRTRNDQCSIVDDIFTTGDISQNIVDIRKRTRRNYSSGIFFYDNQVYLPRYDTLYEDKNGDFILLTGEPRLSPDKPVQPSNSLLMANIYIPAYPRITSDLRLDKWDSQRFRQEDIKNLERRLSAVEEFVLGNQLELLALNQELDPGDIARGIMVDDFSGHGVADVNNPEYSAAIDPIAWENGNSLRLPFQHEYFDLALDLSSTNSIGSNMLIGDKLITLDFAEEIYIGHNKASGSFNVNPYDTFEWLGNMTLRPAIDTWVDTTVQPDIVEDSNLQHSNFAGDNPVVGYERKFNFWFDTPMGVDKQQVRTNNARFNSSPPISVTDAQTTGGLSVADRSDNTESELRDGSTAWNPKLTGFQSDLT